MQPTTWERLEKRRRWRQSPAGRNGNETEDETGDEICGPGDETDDETAATAGDETSTTGGVMYTGEGELEFDDDVMAALEVQRLVAELFPDSGSEPDFEGFHASEPAGNLSGGDNSGSEAVTKSNDDEGVTGRLSDAAALAAYLTNPNLPD